MSLFGPPDVDKMERNRDIKGLIKAIRYKGSYTNSGVRNRAIQALGRLKDRSAVDALIEALADRHLRQDAWNALGSIGDPKAIDPLLRVLTRYQKYSESDRYERESLLGALAEFADERLMDIYIQEPYHCKHGLRSLGSRAAPALLGLLRDTNSGTAAELLGDMGDQRAVDLLVPCLRTGSRSDAANALKKLGWKPQLRDQVAEFMFATQDWEGLKGLGIDACMHLTEVFPDDHRLARWIQVAFCSHVFDDWSGWGCHCEDSPFCNCSIEQYSQYRRCQKCRMTQSQDRSGEVRSGEGYW